MPVFCHLYFERPSDQKVSDKVRGPATPASQTKNNFRLVAGHAHVRAQQPEGLHRRRSRGRQRRRPQGPGRQRDSKPGAERDRGLVVEEGETQPTDNLILSIRGLPLTSRYSLIRHWLGGRNIYLTENFSNRDLIGPMSYD